MSSYKDSRLFIGYSLQADEEERHLVPMALGLMI